MERCPRIGDRVRYTGCSVVGPCVGTVTAIYKNEVWANDRPTGKIAPESEWQVGVKVDQTPELWPYLDTDRFAPEVIKLQKL